MILLLLFLIPLIWWMARRAEKRRILEGWMRIYFEIDKDLTQEERERNRDLAVLTRLEANPDWKTVMRAERLRYDRFVEELRRGADNPSDTSHIRL